VTKPRTTLKTPDDMLVEDKNPASKTLVVTSGLTECQEMFCKHITSGATQLEAYRSAYNTSMADSAVSVKASELRHKPHIDARIKELIDNKEKRLKEIQYRSHERWYESIWKEADNGDTSSARVSALREIGKAIGITKPNEEIIKHETAVELAAELSERLSDLGININVNELTEREEDV